MIEDYIPKILDYGMAVFILWYIGNKIDNLSKKIDNMNNHLTTIADNINILRISRNQ